MTCYIFGTDRAYNQESDGRCLPIVSVSPFMITIVTEWGEGARAILTRKWSEAWVSSHVDGQVTHLWKCLEASYFSALMRRLLNFLMLSPDVNQESGPPRVRLSTMFTGVSLACSMLSMGPSLYEYILFPNIFFYSDHIRLGLSGHAIQPWKLLLFELWFTRKSQIIAY